MDNYETTDASMGVADDPLHQVLALERKAEGIVRDAEAEAVRLTAGADTRIAEIQAHARQEINDQLSSLQAASDQTVASTAHTITAEAENQWETWKSLATENIDKAAVHIVDIILAGAKA